MNYLVNQINRLYEDNELIEKLMVLPDYNSSEIEKGKRIVSLMDIYKIFIPTQTTIEIYNQLYLSVISSLEKKETIIENSLINDNFREMKGLRRYGIIGGLESFKITGNAGLGKTSNVQRCIDIIAGNNLIETKTGRKIIPILMIECVADGSFKSLLISILQAVDNRLGTSYLVKNNHPTVTVDILLNAVSNVLINHVAVLVIDEIERVANDSRKGTTLINYLTQLVNQSNISICFVGNECSNNFFETKEYMSRRTLGLSIKKLDYDDSYFSFMSLVFKYQYTLKKIKLDGELLRLFYKYSNGIPSMIISLFVEVQKRVILNGTEKITADELKNTFEFYFANMHSFIDISSIKLVQEPKNKPYLSQNIMPSKKTTLFEKTRYGSNMDINKMIEILSKEIKVGYIKL